MWRWYSGSVAALRQYVAVCGCTCGQQCIEGRLGASQDTDGHRGICRGAEKYNGEFSNQNSSASPTLEFPVRGWPKQRSGQTRTRSAGKSVYQGKPHIGLSET